MDDESTSVQRARSGDLAAFNDLILTHQALVYNLCLRMLGQPAAAEDATQEAFLLAWRSISRLRGTNFRSWLLRIAANVSTDELRRRGRRPASSLEVALEAGVPEPPDPAPAAETGVLDAELRGRIDAALAHLPAEQRLVVVLCDIQELDYEEAARVMQTSLGTVKSRLSRARARLRALLLADPELLPSRFRPESEEVT